MTKQEEARHFTALAIDSLVRGLVNLNAGTFHCGVVGGGPFETASNYAAAALKNLGFFFVPSCYLGWFSKEFDRLTKRAVKLGKDAPSYTVHGTDVRRIYGGRSYLQPYVMISLQGEAPVVNGSKFLARIEHTSAGNIVSAAPGVVADPAWSQVDTRCDHCNAKRRRVDTFAVEVEGVVKFIGRNCLADFVRGEDVESALHIWKFLSLVNQTAGSDSEEYGSWGGGCRYTIEPLWLAACAAKAIRQMGYVGRLAAGEGRPSTASMAAFAADVKPINPEAARAWALAQPEEIDVAMAAKATKWVTESTDVSGFMSNARVAMALPGLKPRHYGLVTAVPYSYRKNQEKALLDAERAAREASKVKPAGFFGEVGKRYDFTGLKIVMVRATEQWGTTTVVKLTDSEGHSYTWFASGEKTYEAGQVVDGRATVKKHDSNAKYGDSTHLTRCSFTVREEPAV